jgi:hypothetical protein
LGPHVDAAGLALTGGVAMAFHLPGSRAELRDVDFVARHVDVVRPSLARDWLVSHYHVAGPGVRKSLVQLVDPETRLRLDIFPDQPDTIARAERYDARWLVVAAADLFAHKQALLARPPVDEKHWQDAVALAAFLGKPPSPRPAIAPDVYSQDLTLACERCSRSASPEFPLADKRAIFDLLGYV